MWFFDEELSNQRTVGDRLLKKTIDTAVLIVYLYSLNKLKSEINLDIFFLSPPVSHDEQVKFTVHYN